MLQISYSEVFLAICLSWMITINRAYVYKKIPKYTIDHDMTLLQVIISRYTVKRVKFVGFLTLICAHLFAVVQPRLFSVSGSRGFISASVAKYCHHCKWIITVPSNHTVKLKFTIFRLSDYPRLPNEAWVGQAKIQVHDGKRNNDTVLGVFTGTRQPFIIQTSGRFMMFTLQKEYYFTPCNFKGTFIGSRKGKRK